MSEVNWSDLHKQGEDATRPVPDGDYPIIVTESELKRAQTGSMMIVVKMKISDGPQSGRMLFSNIVFSTEKAFALAMWFRTLAAFGIDVNFLNTLQGDIEQQLSVIATLLKGRFATVTAGTRNWHDQDRNEIKAWGPAPLGVMQPSLALIGGGGLPGGIGATGLKSSSPMAVTPGGGPSLPPMPGGGGTTLPKTPMGPISVTPTVTQGGTSDPTPQDVPSTPPPDDAF